MKKQYRGNMTEESSIQLLKNLAARIGVPEESAYFSYFPDKVELIVHFGDFHLAKQCSSQPTKLKNMACLVLWLQDVVRSIERRIDTFREAFFNEGGKLLAGGSSTYGDIRENLYKGEKSVDDAALMIEKSLARLELTMNDVKVSWADGKATMLLRLGASRVVKKESFSQKSEEKNVVALALWLQTKVKNWERGLEENLKDLFAANLLPRG